MLAARDVRVVRKHVAHATYVRRLPIPDSDVIVGTPRDGIVALPARRIKSRINRAN